MKAKDYNFEWSKEVIKHINSYLADYVIESPRTEYEKGWNAAIDKMQQDNMHTLMIIAFNRSKEDDLLAEFLYWLAKYKEWEMVKTEVLLAEFERQRNQGEKTDE